MKVLVRLLELCRKRVRILHLFVDLAGGCTFLVGREGGLALIHRGELSGRKLAGNALEKGKLRAASHTDARSASSASGLLQLPTDADPS